MGSGGGFGPVDNGTAIGSSKRFLFLFINADGAGSPGCRVRISRRRMHSRMAGTPALGMRRGIQCPGLSVSDVSVRVPSWTGKEAEGTQA